MITVAYHLMTWTNVAADSFKRISVWELKDIIGCINPTFGEGYENMQLIPIIFRGYEGL